jgi:isopentenyldiphosphate isomerase
MRLAYHSATLREVSPDDELLEVHDAAGRATGVAKTRAAVHRDGDWHLAFFCWIVRHGAGAGAAGLDVVLQKRAADKDVWPGRFDASAAGHVRFGESVVEAAREIEEELGLVAPSGALVPVMRHHQEHVHDSGLVDREIHDVHLWRNDEPLESYRPGPEVIGIAAAPLADVIALATGARTSLATSLVTFDARGRATHTPIALKTDDLVPYDAAYWEKLARAARAL